jgi:hypothetical protein
MWRTIARASRPPSPIGRFAGTLPAERLSSLRTAAAACAKAHAVSIAPAPGASTDRVRVGSKTASWGDDQTPAAPWDRLATVLRTLLSELASSPRAAVTVEVHDGRRAWLRHVGTEGIELDLSGATVRAVQWEDGVATGQWQSGVEGPRSATAEPGWAYELPFAHDLPAGSLVTAHVDNLLAFDGEFWRACSVQTDPALRADGGAPG